MSPIVIVSFFIIFSGLVNFKNGQASEEQGTVSKPDTTTGNNTNGVQILSNRSFTDSLGNMHVIGELQNNNPSRAILVTIVGTFYDFTNKVVATQFTYANPQDVDSGQKARFKIVVGFASISISVIDHYDLQVNYE